MYVIYIDESGTPAIEPNSKHFVVAGLSLPLRDWKQRDAALRHLKRVHRLEGTELHAAWMARRYPEQERIVGFEAMDDAERRKAVRKERKKDLAKRSLSGDRAVRGLRKNYRKTEGYVHLTYEERRAFLRAVADALGTWKEARLFGEVQAKQHLTPSQLQQARAMALEQIATRYNTFLEKVCGPSSMAVMVHDQHQAASTGLTELVRGWHRTGTAYSAIPHIAETPFFVDSSLTAMVQVADLVAYATRRFFDANEEDLFRRVYDRFDRLPDGTLVGLRHFTSSAPCRCRVCVDHGREA